MGRLLVGGLSEDALQALARTGERGHDRADGDAGNGGNLLVRAAFEFTQYDDFAEAHRERFESASQPLAVVTRDGQRFRRRGRLRVQVFVEFSHELHLAVLLQPRITRIADDLQEPCAGVATVETPEETKRT